MLVPVTAAPFARSADYVLPFWPGQKCLHYRLMFREAYNSTMSVQTI